VHLIEKRVSASARLRFRVEGIETAFPQRDLEVLPPQLYALALQEPRQTCGMPARSWASPHRLQLLEISGQVE
jgi:hypothetical protein